MQCFLSVLFATVRARASLTSGAVEPQDRAARDGDVVQKTPTPSAEAPAVRKGHHEAPDAPPPGMS